MIIRVTHSGAVLQGPEQFDSFRVLADPLADVPAVLDRAGARKASPEVELASDTPVGHVMIDVEWYAAHPAGGPGVLPGQDAR